MVFPGVAAYRPVPSGAEGMNRIDRMKVVGENDGGNGFEPEPEAEREREVGRPANGFDIDVDIDIERGRGAASSTIIPPFLTSCLSCSSCSSCKRLRLGAW